jgi:hypothetical protein
MVLDQKLKERDEFIDNNTGGDDLHKNYRNKLIKSLPDLADVMKKADNATSIGSADQEKLEKEEHSDEEQPSVESSPEGAKQ